MSFPARKLAPAFAALVLALAVSAPAQAANWTCEGSAVRGTVLGSQTLEPITANKGAQVCAPSQVGGTGLTAALPLPVDVSALNAVTTLVGADGPVATQKAGAFGGITDLTVRALPELPIQIPIPALPTIPTVDVLGQSVNLAPAVQALLPDGKLPNVDLLRLRAVSALAGGECADGVPVLSGTSNVAGITALGQELPVNQLVERTLTVVDTQSIDPSDADLTDVALPLGITLDTVIPLVGTVRSLLQSTLDQLPEIVIPPALATVKITPGSQTREGDRLIQRALQVQVGLLGQSLVDLLVGEASVGSSQVDCAAPQTAGEAALDCTTRKLVLADVLPGDRVKLQGYADRSLVGKTVNILLTATGDRVARAVVRPDGSFQTTAPLPPESIRSGDLARYQAVVDDERSFRLKLLRRMVVDRVTSEGRRVTVSGRVIKPLASPPRAIEVRRRVSCGEWQVVDRIRPDRNGRFRTTLQGPPELLAATYRFATRVRSSAGGRSRKTFETFTLPLFVDLG